MRTSWEKLVQFVSTNYGQDISNELQNKMTVTLPKPTHMDAVMQCHMQCVQMIRNVQAKLSVAREQQCILLEAAVAAQQDADAPMKLAILENEITQAEFKASVDVPIELTDSEKTQHSNKWRTYQERNAQLIKNHGQAFSLILGQCTQLLQDKMKQDADWEAVSTSYNPLQLY
jgi:hypothetical protein